MRLLLLVLVAVFLVSIDATFDSKDVNDAVVRDALPKPVFAGDVTPKRFLRVKDSFVNKEEERDITSWSVLKILFQATRSKSKRTIMLSRGINPDKAARKMKVTSLTDKGFNDFKRYYSEYITKYPKKAETMPKSAEDAVVLPKLDDWLVQKLLPAEIKMNLKEIGVRETAKYLQLYTEKAELTVIVPRLNEWLSQKVPPTRLGPKLFEIGVTDAKYVEMYTKAFDDAIVLPKMNQWLNSKLFPQLVPQKLKELGLNDAKYLTQYMSMWGKRQAELSAKMG